MLHTPASNTAADWVSQLSEEFPQRHGHPAPPNASQNRHDLTVQQTPIPPSFCVIVSIWPLPLSCQCPRHRCRETLQNAQPEGEREEKKKAPRPSRDRQL